MRSSRDDAAAPRGLRLAARIGAATSTEGIDAVTGSDIDVVFDASNAARPSRRGVTAQGHCAPWLTVLSFFAALTWLYAIDEHGLHHAVATLEPAECARWTICCTC